MDIRFTAGEFAKLCGLSKQALLFYDKQDVVKPKYRDPANGYRYYTADQLEQLDSIMILREMGLSLEEIRQYMHHRTLENSLQMLDSQRTAIREKIETLTAIEHRIDRKTRSLRQFYHQSPDFRLETLPEQLLAVTEVPAPHGLLQVDLALKDLMKQIKATGANHLYTIGDSVPMAHLLEQDFLNFQWAFLPVETREEGLQVLRKPAGEYAVQSHFGPYETMGETYSQMLEHIRRAGREIGGDSYEFCVLDSLTSASPAYYCTQIQILLR